jgi:hypothetical protein
VEVEHIRLGKLHSAVVCSQQMVAFYQGSIGFELLFCLVILNLAE